MRPRVRTILVAVSLTVFLLPLAGLGALRLYDNELIRQTEAALVSQTALVEAAYLDRLRPELIKRSVSPENYGHVGSAWTAPTVSDDGARRFRPSPVGLDITQEEILEPSIDPIPTQNVDPVAHDVGPMLYRFLRTAQEVTLSGIRIVDTHATIVVSTRGESGLSLAGHPEVERALTGETVHLLRRRVLDGPKTSLDSMSRRHPIRVFVGAPIVLDGRVVGAVIASRTPVSLQKALHNNRVAFLIYALLLLAIVVGISLVTALAINAPIRALIRQARRVQDGQRPERIARPVTTEFEELSEAFVAMAAQLDERRAYTQAFARAVSHEFKTPISSIQGATELLLDHFETMEPERRVRFLNHIAEDTERMNRLVTRLHELAKAESGPIEPVCCDVTTLVNQLGEDIEVDCPNGIVAAIAPDALESVLTNLAQNARRYGEAPILLSVRSSQDGAEISIEISDAGPGVSAANVDRIFETFFTTGREIGGTGMGLSISRKLVEAHGGLLILSDAAQAQFTIVLKRPGS